MVATSFWTSPSSEGRKRRSMAMLLQSGNAVSWIEVTAAGTIWARCCFAAAMDWILRSTCASRFFSSRLRAMSASFSCQRAHSSCTCSSQSLAMVVWRWYQLLLKSFMVAISCSSSTSIIDCSSVLLTRTSRIGSTSRSKSKSSPSSTCVWTSTPVFCGWYCSTGGSGRSSSVWAVTVSTSMITSLAIRCLLRSTATRGLSGSGMSNGDGSFFFLRVLGEKLTWVWSWRASLMAFCANMP
mmetsp:Transcript_9419/g.28018  ORF Transcript_9419/g.28018 Transcript_9419/m.28018 type:complete len:240 (-) Transcript_9419:307-1026(-)